MVKRGILLLCIVMALFILPTTALAIVDPATAAISGNVSYIKGGVTSPIPDVDVTLYLSDGSGGWIQWAGIWTDSEGNYSFNNLLGSTYRIGFDKYQYVTSYYGGAESIDLGADINLAPGETRGSIDSTLVSVFGDDLSENNDVSANATQLTLDVVGQPHTLFPAGEEDWYKFPVVEGKQYDIETYYPVNMDTCVTLYNGADLNTELRYDDDGGTWNFSKINWVATFTGDAYLKITGYGGYSVGNYDLWVSQVSPTSISGTVTSQDVAVPYAGVTLYTWNADWGEFQYAGYTYADYNGAYRFDQLAPGSYRVSFWADGYEPQWFNSADSIDTATPVDLNSGDAATGIDASLVEMASISGTVTNGTSAIEGARVEVTDSNLNLVGQAYTDADGNYKVRGLDSGNYFVRFSAWGYGLEYFNDVPDAASAETIVLATDEARTGVDAQLATETNPPEVSVQIKGNKTQRVAILLSATDAYPGLGAFLYWIDNGEDQYIDGESALIEQTKPGPHTLHYYASDQFGNATGGSVNYAVAGVPAQVTVNCDITPSAGANGSISPSSGQHVAVGSDSPTFSITPSPGYHVQDVLVDGVSIGAVTSYKFTNVSANHTIAASFAAGPASGYVITPLASDHGTIDPAVSANVSAGSDSATFTITASAGYHVKDVLVDGVSVGAVTAYKFANVTANHTIGAAFAANVVTTKTTLSAPDSVGKSHTLTLKGTVSPSGAKGTVTIKKMHWNGSQWKSMGSVKRTVVSGKFSYSFKPLTSGKWRFTATYNGKAGAPTYRKSTSKTKYVKAL